MIRPEHLPEFKNPPLHEVVLGVQFIPPRTYQQILAGEVWNLFRADYPSVQELQALPPTFETFGLPSSSAQLMLRSGASHDRFWFLTTKGDELIQFQQDRLLHNWRKVGDGTNEYPRFEGMVKRFEDELVQFERYINSLSPQSLQITQCEITYINHISPKSGEVLLVGDWLRPLSLQAPIQADDFSLTLRQTIHDVDGKPRGRLVVEAMTAFTEDGVPLIALNITVRGAPKDATSRSALDLICKGRELIVTRFSQLTTEAAHKRWGRIK